MSVKIVEGYEEAIHQDGMIRYYIEQIKLNFIDLGSWLYHFVKDESYKKLGHPSFESYIASPDLDIGRSTAYMLKGIYETYIVDLKSPTAGLMESSPERLEIIRPYVNNGNYDELLSQAQTLSRTDLRKSIREKYGVPEKRDTFPDAIKLCKNVVYDSCASCDNAVIRGLLEQIYKLLDEVLRRYDV